MIKAQTRHKPQWYRQKRNQPVTLFKRAWVWSEAEERLYSKLTIGSVLHLCCGYSDLGDCKIDINPEVKPDLVADIHFLPFKDGSFDTVIIDPPWYGPQTWNKWEQLAHEIVRVAKKRVIIVLGNLIYILPKPFELREVYVLKKISPMVKLVYIWDRAYKEVV